ncbi:MAG: hypothetical protein JXR10_02460 [Cyclobacteriaceae bacterium]
MVTFGQVDQLRYHSAFEQEAFAENNSFKILLAADSEVDQAKYNLYREDLNSLIQKLSKYADKRTTISTAEKAFYYTHKNLLHDYDKYVTLGDMFESGKYDCLTGTALYGLILQALEIPFEIYEFENHVMLMAHIDDASVLIESTDPLMGFETEANHIRARFQKLGNSQSGEMNAKSISSQNPLDLSGVVNKISLKQITGLQYYNLAIKAYNNNELLLAQDYLDKAQYLYKSERMDKTLQFFDENIVAQN